MEHSTCLEGWQGGYKVGALRSGWHKATHLHSTRKKSGSVSSALPKPEASVLKTRNTTRQSVDLSRSEERLLLLSEGNSNCDWRSSRGQQRNINWLETESKPSCCSRPLTPSLPPPDQPRTFSSCLKAKAGRLRLNPIAPSTHYQHRQVRQLMYQCQVKQDAAHQQQYGSWSKWSQESRMNVKLLPFPLKCLTGHWQTFITVLKHSAVTCVNDYRTISQIQPCWPGPIPACLLNQQKPNK